MKKSFLFIAVLLFSSSFITVAQNVTVKTECIGDSVSICISGDPCIGCPDATVQITGLNIPNGIFLTPNPTPQGCLGCWKISSNDLPMGNYTLSIESGGCGSSSNICTGGIPCVGGYVRDIDFNWLGCCGFWTLKVNTASTCEEFAGGAVIYKYGSIIDTFYYGANKNQWDEDTLVISTTDPIFILGYLDFGASDECLTAKVLFNDCNEICGNLFSYSGSDGYIKTLTIPVETGTLVFDVQTYNVPDRLVAIANGDTIVDLSWGANNLPKGGLVGPFLWENGKLSNFLPIPDSIPYWDKIGVEKELNAYGLARFILTIPTGVCQVSVTMISNDTSLTSWKLFQHCCKDCIPVLPEEYTRDTLFCNSGIIDSTMFTQNANYTQYSKSSGGCNIITHWKITVSKLPILEVEKPEDSCLGQPITIPIFSDEKVLYESTSGLTGIYTGEKIVIPKTFVTEGENRFFFLATNSVGCTTDTTITVTMSDCRVFFPNVFSPNGDGINDSFYPFSGDGIVSEVISMIIFDRWGEFIWKNDHFQTNQITSGWNGTFRGKPFHLDVAVYKANVKFFDGSCATYTGDVTLMR